MTAGGLKPALMRLAFYKFTAARAEPLEAVEHHTSSSTGGEEDNSKVCTHTDPSPRLLQHKDLSQRSWILPPSHVQTRNAHIAYLRSLLPRREKRRANCPK